MPTNKKETVNVQGTEIAVLAHRQDDYISLTDMAKYKNAEIPSTVISHWMSTAFSINYVGLSYVLCYTIATQTRSGSPGREQDGGAHQPD